MRYVYQITVTHPGLGKERILSGYDKYVLESRARELTARWNEQYAKKLEMSRRASDRLERQHHVEQSLEEARTRTDEATRNREALENLLMDAIKLAPFDWESLKTRAEYHGVPPLPPTYKNCPAEPPPVVPKIGVLGKLIASRAKAKRDQAAQLSLLKKQQWIEQVKNIKA